MYINGRWLEEPEIIAYIAELEDEIKLLKESLARHSEEEYD